MENQTFTHFSLWVIDQTESGTSPFREHARCPEYRDMSSAPEPEHVKMQPFRSSFSTRFKKKKKEKKHTLGSGICKSSRPVHTRRYLLSTRKLRLIGNNKTGYGNKQAGKP